MYTGHVAVAIAARAARRDVPLWVLAVAAQACDWMEVLLGAFRVRDAALWSHAFPFVVLAAVASAVLVGAWKRSAGAAVLVLIVYLSHPIADLITGYKPLWTGGPPVGLHFIDRPVADFVAQASLCVIGWAIYARSMRTAQSRRALVVAPLVALLALQGVSDLIVFVRKSFRPSSVQTGVVE